VINEGKSQECKIKLRYCYIRCRGVEKWPKLVLPEEKGKGVAKI
jgi:hypothetical protein